MSSGRQQPGEFRRPDTGGSPATDDGRAADEPTPPEDQIAYAELVDRAAELIQRTGTTMDEVAPKPYHDATVDEFHADVEERLADLEAQADADEDDEPDPDPSASPTDVDWTALWAEFGFDSEDGAGHNWVSPTQLTGALECTEQAVSGDSRGLIRDAEEEGILRRLTIVDDHGSICTRGYVLLGGEAR